METWAWLLAYVVGFGLLQGVLYHHFRRNDATPDTAGSATERGGGQAGDPGHADAHSDATGRYCQHCGTHNEHFRSVRYCHECVKPLR